MSTVSEQVKAVPPAVQPIVEAAIKVIRQASPGAEAISYNSSPPRSRSMVWKLVRFASGGENVVGVGTLTKHSILFFYRGRELDDGSGLLQGGGKEMRFIRLETAADAERPEVKAMVRKAFKLAI
jgi:hypothetical protein